MDGIAKKIFYEKWGVNWGQNRKPRWPFLWDLVQKEENLFFAYFFAEKMHPQGDENEAALLMLVMARSQEGHICINIYPNNLKNREFDKEASQNSDLERVTIAHEQGTSEDQNFETKLTLSKNDSSSCLGIKSLLDSRWEVMAKEGAKTLCIKEICRDENRFYLQKNWLIETNVATQVKRLLMQKPKEGDSDNTFDLTAEQKSALEKALRFPFSLITGGPGTGKSFTAMQIVSAFIREGAHKIILCAPTGKAVRHLALKCPFEQVRANTLHTILKVGKDIEPLEADLVIVDECSMVDAALFSRLLSSIKEGTHLVLMGDPDQLPAIEGGSFFADLIAVCQKGFSLPCTHLTHCLRSDVPEILTLAAAVKEGHWTHPAKKLDDKEIWEEIKDFFPFPSESLPNGEELLQKMGQFRILSTLRKGPFGVDTINENIAEIILREKKSDHYCPIPIIIGRNDERTSLFNGEMGVLIKTPRAEEEYAVFDHGRIFPAALLPFYEYAYCLSVHKSQGSEYDHVLLLVPEGSDYFGKELLYTAVTRARKGIQIRGEAALIRAILNKSSHKMSGLSLLFSSKRCHLFCQAGL